MMIFSKVMVMKLNEGLDCFFHRSQLNECHFAIFPKVAEETEKVHRINFAYKPLPQPLPLGVRILAYEFGGIKSNPAQYPLRLQAATLP